MQTDVTTTVEIDDEEAAHKMDVSYLELQTAVGLAKNLLSEDDVLKGVIEEACPETMEDAFKLLVEDEGFLEHLRWWVRTEEGQEVLDLPTELEAVVSWLNNNSTWFDVVVQGLHTEELSRLAAYANQVLAQRNAGGMA